MKSVLGMKIKHVIEHAMRNGSFSYRPIIVWAMNDKLLRNELTGQLDAFKKCGYGGVMVMPWGGLPYRFMDDAWLDAVGHILEYAEKIDIEIWIWDDWCFSSGTAGGELTRLHPEYRAQKLKIAMDFIIEPGEQVEFILPPRAVSGSIFPVNKFGNPTGTGFTRVTQSDGQVIKIQAETRQRVMVISWEYISGMQHTTQSHGAFLEDSSNAEKIDIRIFDDRAAWSVDMMNPEAAQEYIRLLHQKYHAQYSKHFGKTLKGFFYDEPKASSHLPWTKDFPERFERIKGYGLTQYLPSIMLDYIMDSANFNDVFRPEKIERAEADYRDAWTTLVSESFYKVIQNWCRKHNAISTGHPIGDGTINGHRELYSNGGVYRKNMSFSDMPGIDTVWGTIVPGKFCDNPRFAGSMAASLGVCRAMSESFAVYGHGIDIDQMRFVFEHQIIRGVNTFFCKLSNYNRERSLHFHPPELSDYNPVIRHYGSALCRRIENIASLMNSGMPEPRAALYVPMSNYYTGDKKIAEQLAATAEKLTYNQIEYDYVYDRDLERMRKSKTAIYNEHGQLYSAIIIPQGSIIDAKSGGKLDSFGNAVLKADRMSPDEIVDYCRNGNKTDFSIISKDAPVSIRARVLEKGVRCVMFLNESRETEKLSVSFSDKISVCEFDPCESALELLRVAGPGELIELKFTPSESKLLIFDKTGKYETRRRESLVRGKETPIQNWVLNTPDGNLIKLRQPLPDWGKLGFSAYTGFMRYRAEFAWNGGKDALLSLGELCYAATICIDGRKAGDCLFTPFEIRLSNLSKGKHALEIEVMNTMANSIFGDRRKLEKLRRAGAFKGTYAPFYEKLDVQKLRSGLLGPVKIFELRANQEEL